MSLKINWLDLITQSSGEIGKHTTSDIDHTSE
jgi:hypothetical protein